MPRLISLFVAAFPLWILLSSAVALVKPEVFTWFHGPWIRYGLSAIMLGMGLTLKLEDFQAVLKLPRAGVIGVVCQFLIMPFLGWATAYGLGLHQIDPSLAVGLILVSCCPGGTASNVIAYLARANVALSVLMTIVSTSAAIFLTPLMTKWLAGTLVDVDAWALFRSTISVVLIPVALGVLINRYAPRWAGKIGTVSPSISVLAIILIVASVIGQKQEIILQAGWRLLLAPMILHLGGFTLGYIAARIFRLPEDSARTISIEVGMQNSGLGTVLANQHFPGTPASAPCALSAVYHCLVGSLVAAFWRRRGSHSK